MSGLEKGLFVLFVLQTMSVAAEYSTDRVLELSHVTVPFFFLLCPCEHFILVRYKWTFLQTNYGGLDQTPFMRSGSILFAYVQNLDYADID